jgi:hypothetical protein
MPIGGVNLAYSSDISHLRAPLLFDKTENPEPESDLTFGFNSMDPLKHDPTKEWVYLTHTGMTGPGDWNTDKLISLLQDLSSSRKEIICCYYTNSEYTEIWKERPAGFILDISKSGEVLYAGPLRKDKDTIWPLKMNENEREALKEKLRQNRIIIKLSKKIDPQEVDVTKADVAGIFLKIDMLSEDLKEENLYKKLEDDWYFDNFNLLMAIAWKYDLPIVLMSDKEISENYAAIFERFEKILDQCKQLDNIKNKLLQQVNPGLDFIQHDIDKKLPNKRILSNS